MLAWLAGTVCLVVFNVATGALLYQVFPTPEPFRGMGAIMVMLPMLFLVPCIIFTGLVALVCGLLASTVKKSVIASVAVNLGITALLLLLASGMLPSINIGLH